MVKDVGVVAVEGGKWEIYIGGAAGAHIRKGDILCTVDSTDAVMKYMSRFVQYYRKTLNIWSEPTALGSVWASTSSAPSLWRTASESEISWRPTSTAAPPPTPTRGKQR